MLIIRISLQMQIKYNQSIYRILKFIFNTTQKVGINHIFAKIGCIVLVSRL